MRIRVAVFLACVLAAGFATEAHVGDHPSIHNVLAEVIERLRESKSADELLRLRADDVLPILNEEERHVLATEFLSFTVDQPVTVYVMRHEGQRETPFWLEQEGFSESEMTMTVDAQTFKGWAKDFPAGRVGLGVNGFAPHGLPYFTVLVGQDGAEFQVEDIYPGRHRATKLREGGFVYSDETEPRIEALPDGWVSATLITGLEERNEEAQLTNVFRETPYPATTAPDHIVLTWSGNPKTTQTVQWRTSRAVTDGMVQWKTASGEGDANEVAAAMHVLEDKYLANDAINHRYTAVMEGLEPGTAYTYRVGSPEQDIWSDWAQFTTAPAETTPFSFIYMGDAQNGLDTWGQLIQKAYGNYPEAAFYVMAGDLVNKGNDRDDWDNFFQNATGVFNHRPIVPAIGNHECQGSEGPWMYLSLFDLPKTGPESIPAERAYTLEYSNALFIVLDSNLPPHQQAGWLEDQLANTKATWKFVVYHHPAYSSGPTRNNPLVRQQWGALFDKYHVDLALQGHDHAYLRTYPMKGDEAQDSPAGGTIYIVSVSGTKMYDQGDFDYTEVGFTNVSTYQVLDITIDGDKLVYKAYDVEGVVRDEFVIEK
jgi:hypothetical protein